MPGSSSQGARKPGVCAPCPGAVMISILLQCPVELRYLNVEGYEVAGRKFVDSLQLASIRMSSSRHPLRSPSGGRPLGPFGSLGGEAAEGDGHPQGETVPPGRRRVFGELGDAAQPVTDRVRMDEQQPGGGL